MGRSLAFMVIGLFFGVGGGFFLAAANNVTLDGHDHSAHGAHGNHGGGKAQGAGKAGGHAHNHGPVDLPAGPNAPTLKIRLVKDTMTGWNLQLFTTNFSFTPKQVNKAHVAGEGHAHVYVNGKKLTRLYGPWMHIGHLPKGKVTLSVTLNANTHGLLRVGGKPLKVSETLTVD